MAEWKTVFKINDKLESVEFVIIWDENSYVKLPVIWMSFLDLFKSELSMNFKKRNFDLTF